jgi:hypothetical protein
MRSLTEALVLKRFEPHQSPVLFLNAGTGFGYVLGISGDPVRVAGPQVCVPLHNRLKEEGIAKVLVAASAANPLNLGSPKALAEKGGFWQKYPTPQAILSHPELVGRFFNPGFQVFPMEVVPEGSLIFLRPPPMVGYLVSQGPKWGVLAHCKEGLLTIRFSVW